MIGLVAVMACVVSLPGVASARSQRNLDFRPDLTWTAALRLLRIDMGFELVERDAEARFVIFSYVDGNHSYPGTLEIAERPLDDGRSGVRVIVSVPSLPSYVELNLIDRLERKLVEEVGAPPPPPRPRPQATASERNSDRAATRRDDDEDDEAREGSGRGDRGGEERDDEGDDAD
jgi:hypothetical protein